MALNQDMLDAWIKEHGPYLYHGTYDEIVPQILKEGLKPGWSADMPATHVFLGDEGIASVWADIRGSQCEESQIRVDLRLLDPAFIDVDPDIYFEDWMLIEDGCIGLCADGQIAKDEDIDGITAGEPDHWEALDLHYLAEPSSTEDTLRSLSQGTCAYRGRVPAEALSPSPAYEAALGSDASFDAGF